MFEQIHRDFMEANRIKRRQREKRLILTTKSSCDLIKSCAASAPVLVSRMPAPTNTRELIRFPSPNPIIISLHVTACKLIVCFPIRRLFISFCSSRMFTSRNHAAADVGELLESIYQAIRFRYTGNSCAIDGDLCCCCCAVHVGRKDLSLADTEIVLNIARD